MVCSQDLKQPQNSRISPQQTSTQINQLYSTNSNPNPQPQALPTSHPPETTLALATVSKDPRGEVGKDDDKRAAAQLWDACLGVSNHGTEIPQG